MLIEGEDESPGVEGYRRQSLLEMLKLPGFSFSANSRAEWEALDPDVAASAGEGYSRGKVYGEGNQLNGVEMSSFCRTGGC